VLVVVVPGCVVLVVVVAGRVVLVVVGRVVLVVVVGCVVLVVVVAGRVVLVVVVPGSEVLVVVVPGCEVLVLVVPGSEELVVVVPGNEVLVVVVPGSEELVEVVPGSEELVVVDASVVVVDPSVVVVVPGAVSHVGAMNVSLIKVTAPLRARARPRTVTLSFRLIEVRAMTLPTIVELVPSVAELPTCQKTLHSWAPLISDTVLPVAVMSDESVWKMKTVVGSPAPSRTRGPVRPKAPLLGPA